MSDAAHAQQRLTGSVLWFNLDKHYGFIRIDGQSRDIFFHGSDWTEERDPHAGARVQFVEGAGRSGKPCARQIVVIE
jgi:cold shock CspA family protein